MAMEIVNGYVCNNCTDVESAKKGVNPARPKEGAEQPAPTEASAPAERGPAVTFGGNVQPSASPPSVNGVEAVPPSKYVPGSSITLTV